MQVFVGVAAAESDKGDGERFSNAVIRTRGCAEDDVMRQKRCTREVKLMEKKGSVVWRCTVKGWYGEETA